MCHIVFMNTISLSFRTEEGKRAQLDAIAKALDRNRNWVINEAIEYYLDLHRWQLEEIKKGEEDIKAGRWLTSQQVRERLEKQIGKKKRTA
jgi:predicted transcriptional regulator